MTNMRVWGNIVGYFKADHLLRLDLSLLEFYSFSTQVTKKAKKVCDAFAMRITMTTPLFLYVVSPASTGTKRTSV